MFVVTDQAPVEHQGAVGLLDDPSLALGDESDVGGVAFDDLYLDPQTGTVGQDGVLEPLVDQRLGHGACGACGDLVQQGDPGGVLVCRGGQHDHADDQAEGVHRQASFASRHPLGGVPAGRGGRNPGRDVDALGVQHDQARIG